MSTITRGQRATLLVEKKKEIMAARAHLKYHEIQVQAVKEKIESLEKEIECLQMEKEKEQGNGKKKLSWSETKMQIHLELVQTMLLNSSSSPPSLFCDTVANDIEEIQQINATQINPKYGFQGKKKPSSSYNNKKTKTKYIRYR
jgi:hypothetical protein